MASETEKAQTAQPGGDTIFGKIIRGEIPTKFIYEDEQFKKTAYSFKSNKSLILVHYEGDETVYVPVGHGNSKKSHPPEYTRTAPSVLRKIEHDIKSGDKTAMDVYRENTSNGSVSCEHQGVLNARNVKQVENLVRKVNEEERLSKDDIYNLLLLAYHMDGFIHEVTVFPDLSSIIALPEMISIVTQLLDVNTEDDISFVFFYDTTFKLGDFFVSPLVFRNIIFEDRPIMPVAFLIHGRKKEKTHAHFFELVASSFPKINKTSVPFVTDREIGLVNAIRKNLPACDVLMCWNHLVKDLKFNLQQMGADQANTALYVSHLKDLLRCDSAEEYMTLKDDLIRKWSKPVVVYFEKMEKDILTHSGKWVIDKYQNLYDPFSGITNNACESMNAVIKRLNKYRKLPVDCFVLSMFYLQNYYINEVQRGLAGIGNYTLRTKFYHASIPKDEINVPKQLVKPVDIVKHVMSEIDNVRDTCSKDHISEETESSKIEGANILPLVSDTSDGTENSTMSMPIAEENFTAPSQIEGTNILPLVSDTSDGTESSTMSIPFAEENFTAPSQIEGTNILPLVSDTSDGTESSTMSIQKSDKNLSQKSLAKLTVDNGQVSFNEQHKAFMLTGMQRKVYAVTLLPKETCQCPASSQCYHILAAKQYIGDTVETKPRVINLRMLSKRNLKKNDC